MCAFFVVSLLAAFSFFFGWCVGRARACCCLCLCWRKVVIVVVVVVVVAKVWLTLSFVLSVLSSSTTTTSMKLFVAVLAAAAPAATVASDLWFQTPGNACGDLAGCKCTDATGCKDVAGELHFAGALDSADDCKKTCTDAGEAQCKIWLWSAASKHCWWRLDGVWEPDMKQTDITSGCLESSGATSCVNSCGSCGAAPAPAPKPKNYTNMNGLYVVCLGCALCVPLFVWEATTRCASCQPRNKVFHLHKQI